ncbi:polysaccharide pyruvyl transferase family protein [Paratractidigestivibacter sp.]|uniref:polysaccharide pyruvyl transferase family protein n=1 Tax=Paratractidigestivibacter sp. TaxID=2847316 RepID=UPI002AC8E803|nr:polysaccharide pyruvyl transferase family protein [Paratractidigestivibacter sp.]
MTTGNAAEYRVALMTWYSYLNYGTALQVTALSRTLRSLGCAVDIVRYTPRTSGAVRPKPPSVDWLVCKTAAKVGRIISYATSSDIDGGKEDLFKQFLDNHLSFTAPCGVAADLERLNDCYDAFVCGSDQVWSPACYDPHYFLDFVADDKLKVAYAPSVGLSKVEDQDIARQMVRLCGRIDALSTREESGSKIVSDLTGREVATVIDPTLLVEGSEWRRMGCAQGAVPLEPYLLAYMLGVNENHWKRIYSLGKRLGLPVRLIPVFRKDLGRVGCITESIGPAEYVALIANASYVCTDSFHGVAFSVNLNRDFCVFERFKRDDSGSQNSRVYNILEKMGLEDRLATEDVAEELLARSVDWTDPNARLVAERDRSLAWLESALKTKTSPLEQKFNVQCHRSLCCGCGACSVECPADAIKVQLDEEGFWRASVDEETCVSCGKCRKACPLIEHGDAAAVEDGQLYSFKSSDEKQLLLSSSGGAGAAIAKMAAADSAGALGCAYQDGRGAVSRFVEPGDDAGLAVLAGSKYAQAEPGDALARAASHDGPLYIFGTPCQIQAARNLMAGRSDVTYVDFVCHGVPTRHLLDRYADWLNSELGMDPAKMHVNFRYKPRGWRERYIYTTDGAVESCNHQRRDPYFLLFEAGQCYGSCCYECPWRAASAADVRMADYWGPKFAKDNSGVSMVLAMTKRGREVAARLREAGTVAEQSFADYAMYQQTENNLAPVFRDVLIVDLANPRTGIKVVCDEFAEPVAARSDFYKRLDPLKRMAKRMLGRK